MDHINEFLNAIIKGKQLTKALLDRTLNAVLSVDASEVRDKQTISNISNAFSVIGEREQYTEPKIISCLKVLLHLCFLGKHPDLGDLFIETFTGLNPSLKDSVKKSIGSLALSLGCQFLNETDFLNVTTTFELYDESEYQMIVFERVVLQVMSLFIAKCEDNKLYLINNRKELNLQAIGERLTHRDFACRFLCGLFISRFSVSGSDEESNRQNAIRLSLFCPSDSSKLTLTMQMLKADQIFQTCVANSTKVYNGTFSVCSETPVHATMIIEPRDVIIYRKGFTLLQLSWGSMKDITMTSDGPYRFCFTTDIPHLKDCIFECLDDSSFADLSSTLQFVGDSLTPKLFVSPKVAINQSSNSAKNSMEEVSQHSARDAMEFDSAYEKFENEILDKSLCVEPTNETTTGNNDKSTIKIDEPENALNHEDAANEETKEISETAEVTTEGTKQVDPENDTLVTPLRKRTRAGKASTKSSRPPRVKKPRKTEKVKEADSNLEGLKEQETPCPKNNKQIKEPLRSEEDNSEHSLLDDGEKQNSKDDEQLSTGMQDSVKPEKNTAEPVNNPKSSMQTMGKVKQEPSNQNMNILDHSHQSVLNDHKSIWKQMLKDKSWKKELLTPPPQNRKRQIDLATFTKQGHSTLGNTPSLLNACSSPPIEASSLGPFVKHTDDGLTSSTLISDTNDYMNDVNLQSVKQEEKTLKPPFEFDKVQSKSFGQVDLPNAHGIERCVSLIGKNIYSILIKREEKLKDQLNVFHLNSTNLVEGFQERQKARYTSIQKMLTSVDTSLLHRVKKLIYE
ncbi:meiotic recombination protein Rec10 [Schizosaccharomyces cryophilus OY26]|uniref:Meiotic recombination protein Rec10 n=1 Tax=Schizosaccharomyces cryophilus (strain OY26 / ATCC MYA-4695 / CBS 11777 / NBRC 106824 / NRRL Y48691) TaxID=653667 RepID=S9XDW7_SCHCR|nr:meiotic recombination protein Rec10 [Schizosaccharomyces cryophilus OY26]EPY51971.1 meiotic recombination protein Rec10 [Schizosaccharomyces cryophilus OY26]